MKFGIVIPAHNEGEPIAETIECIESELSIIEHEILVVNDNSKDQTERIPIEISEGPPALRYQTNASLNGFGHAIRFGFQNHSSDYVATMMAGLSDSPYDLIKFYSSKGENDAHSVFGSRWGKGVTGNVPRHL